MIRRNRKIIKKLKIDRWLYGFLVIYVLLVMCLKLNELHSTLLAVMFTVVICYICFWQDFKKKQSYRQMTFDEIDHMKDIDLKKMLKSYYEKLGYKVQNVKYARYDEVKILLNKNHKKYLVVGKVHQKIVDIDILCKIVVLKDKYQVKSLIFATNHYFSKRAIKFARRNKIYLLDRNTLIDFYKQLEGFEK